MVREELRILFQKKNFKLTRFFWIKAGFFFIDAEFVLDWPNRKTTFEFVVNIPDSRNNLLGGHLHIIIKNSAACKHIE